MYIRHCQVTDVISRGIRKQDAIIYRSEMKTSLPEFGSIDFCVQEDHRPTLTVILSCKSNRSVFMTTTSVKGILVSGLSVHLSENLKPCLEVLIFTSCRILVC